MIGAVDIGGTKIAVGMLTSAGEILARTECPAYPERGLQAGLERIYTMLRETAASARGTGAGRKAGGELEGIGVGCTGPVDPMTGRLGWIEFLPGWEGTNLVDELQYVFGVTAFLENDADAAALGELAWGAGKDAKRFIYVTVSTGIGVGMVFDGRLYRGADGAHPELGHHVIDPSGPKCFCGAHGCWESLASGPALAARAGKATAWEACQAAGQGDTSALAAVGREAYYLGLGFANLITLFVPDVIALGGGVMHSRHLFWDKILQTIPENCGLVPFEKTRLVPARLGAVAGLAGAAQVWMKGSQTYA
jgi:glucokinase